MAEELGLSVPAGPQAASKQSKVVGTNGSGEPSIVGDFTPRPAQRAQEASQSLPKDKGKSLAASSSTLEDNSPNHRLSDSSMPVRPSSSFHPSQTLSRDLKVRSLSFEPHLLPFVSILPDFILRNHLAPIRLPRVKGHAFLHHLLGTLS